MSRSFVAIFFVVTVLFGGIGIAKAQVVEHDGVITLTFEGIGDQRFVGDYYNGGVGGNYGISFSSNTLALVDSDAGGSGNFGGEPSPDTDITFLTEGSILMNVLNGITGGLSFYYTAPNYTGSILVYGGLNGTGDVLALLTLPLTPLNGAPDPHGSNSPFIAFGVDFEGTAYSVRFRGTSNQIGFDNITLGSSIPYPNPNTTPDPSAPTPEPATLLLMGAGLLGLLGMRRRFKK